MSLNTVTARSANSAFCNMRFLLYSFLLLFSLAAFADGPMDDGEKCFLKGQYSSAVASYKKALTYDLNENNRALCWYMIGKSYLMAGNMTEARKAFSTILSQYAKTEWLADSYVGLGDTYFREKNYSKAIGLYKNSMTRSYLSRYGSSVYYRLAQAHRGLNETSKASYYENIITTQYPDSLEARLLVSGKGGTSRSSAKTSTPSSTASSAKKYAVQIAYTTRADYAQEYAAKFKKKGYTAYVQMTTSQGKNRYKILIGEFSGREAAEAYLKQFKAKEKVEAFVTEI